MRFASCRIGGEKCAAAIEGNDRVRPLPGQGPLGSSTSFAVFLEPGDTVRVEIEGIGAIENRVVAEPIEAADDVGRC